jgi:hypothetical protein
MRDGLGSQVSTCDGAPWAKMWMTALALPGKCGARGERAGGHFAFGLGADEIAGIEQVCEGEGADMPMPTRFRNWRRVRK